MSDNNEWQSPGGLPQPSPESRPAPQWGEIAPGQWAPPPRPGLIPLHPLGLGDILGGAFRVLRRNPRPVVGAALVIRGIVAVLTIALMGLFTYYGLAGAIDATGSGYSQLVIGQQVQSAASSVFTAILGLVADAVLQGIVTLEVARGTLGEKLPLRELWARARGRVGALVGWSVLVGAVIIVAVLIVAGLIALLAITGGAAGVAFAVLLALLFGAAAVALFAWLGTRLLFVPSAILLERLPIRAAVVRSWTLTRGYFWRTLGIELLVSLIVSVASAIVLTPFTLILGIIVAISVPASAAPNITASFPVFAATTAISALVSAITAIIAVSATSLLYIDLRMRKEGLDLELVRFVEARQTGTELPDPYLPLLSAPPTATTTESPWG